MLAAGDVATAAAWNVVVNDILQFAPFVQGVFTNEAARDAAITSPTEGMHAYITASTIAAATGQTTAVPTGIQTIYNGSVWVCVTPIAGLNTTTSALSTTSTSYVTTLTNDATAISVTLVTGTTALVSFGAFCYGSGISQELTSNYAISGATTISAATNTSGVNVINLNVNFSGGVESSKTRIFTGLTAGTNTFTLSHKISGGTGYFDRRTLTVQGIA